MNNNAAITELETVKKDLQEKLKSVQQTLVMLKSMYNNGTTALENSDTENESDKYSDFDKKATFREKLQYVFKKEKRFLHVREIAEILHNLEPNDSVKSILAKLSPAITYFRKQGAIVKIAVGNSHLNTFWGSKNWVDSEGKPKDEHKYDINQVNNSRKTQEITI